MLEIFGNKLTISKRILCGSFSYKLEKGKIYLLQGPNGCGKTFLLDVITGLHSDFEVKIMLSGKNINKFGITAYKRYKIGLRRMFQTPVLPDDVTISQILIKISSNRNEILTGDLIEASRLLDELGLNKSRYIKELSFGEKRLVEFIFSVYTGGNYIFLDEPFAGLNSKLSIQLISIIKKLSEEGKSILIIDHLFNNKKDLFDEVFQWETDEQQTVRGFYDRNYSRIFSYPITCRSDIRKNLTWRIKKFQIFDREIFKEVNIILPSSSIIILVGKNGSGKSSLLRALGNFTQPFEKIEQEISSDFQSGNLIFSPQPPKIVGDMSVRDNLWLMIGKGENFDARHKSSALDLLSFLGFDSKQLKVKAEVLSGGEAGMIALVGACLSKADIVFLDEPFESFSLSTTEKAYQLIKYFIAMGKRFIVTAHDTNVINLFNAGQIISLDSTCIRNCDFIGKNIN
jgi:ABC-type multidrug transport system ATPase subunit